MPRASAMRSPPCCASNPAASASAKARCAGMVKTVGCSGLPTCDNRLGPGNGGGRTNVKPQPLLRDPVETSLLYRPVPADIGEHAYVGGSRNKQIGIETVREKV